MILKRWESLKNSAPGRRLFNWYFWYFVPYTGSVRPEVLELSAGHSRLLMRDRRRLRNHLNSIHAAALMNFAEAASGLAFVCALPNNLKAIVTQFTIEYKKKARGDLMARCDIALPSNFSNTSEKTPFQVEAQVHDAQGEIVAIGRATWLVSPK